MKYRLIFSTILILASACKQDLPQEKAQVILTEAQKAEVAKFSKALEADLNAYQYDLIRSSWSNTLFKRRIGPLTKTQKTVFDVFWKEEWSDLVLNTNIDLVNHLKYGNGKIAISSLKDLDSCFYLTFSLILNDKYVDFIKYRIDVDKDQPRLSDMCSYKNDKWLSQTIRENMQLATRYTSTSIERRKAYQAMGESQRSLKMGDTLGALAYLYEVPESHAAVYDISLKRLRLAESISDSVFYEVLYAEYQTNKSRYLTYRYAWAVADSAMAHEVMTQIAEDTGEKDLIDSMYAKRYYWY